MGGKATLGLGSLVLTSAPYSANNVPVPLSNHPSHVLPASPSLPSPHRHTREGLVHVKLGLTGAKHRCPISQTSSGSAVLWAEWTGT